jgi:hypothetical protein
VKAQWFLITIEYGARIYYHKRFVFICKQRRFYLSRVIVESFDKLDPVKTKSGWEFRIKKEVIKVSPNLHLEKFIIENYFEWPILRPGALTPAPNNGMQRMRNSASLLSLMARARADACRWAAMLSRRAEL